MVVTPVGHMTPAARMSGLLRLALAACGKMVVLAGDVGGNDARGVHVNDV